MRDWVSNLTIKTAFTSTYMSYRHGSVICAGGRVIAKGVNVRLPIQHNSGPGGKYSVHAEEATIKKLKHRQDVAGAEIYVARVNKAGDVRNSRPCPDCMAKIKSVGIKTVYYSMTDNEWGMVRL